jgi:transcriptional regulator with XRE-family HTH domain
MKQTADVPFEVAQQLRELGERIRIARIRRRKGQLELATACGIGRTTLHRIESGSPSSAIGSVYAVLWALGLLPSTRGVADPDTDAHGKTLEAAQRAKRVRVPSPGDDHDF